MELSVVIPVYNEEENIEPLMREIHGVLGPLGKTYEIIAVDDGSKDDTFTVLRKIRCCPHRGRVPGGGGSPRVLSGVSEHVGGAIA